MKKLFKGFKAWLACLTRADEIYLVIDPAKEDAGFKVLIATYELDDAIEYMNRFNKLNTDKGPWLTKTLVH
tara:strand:+ start:154 stop:366 length:213 start_codon:yes stop_codon:yes gene_type:complete